MADDKGNNEGTPEENQDEASGGEQEPEEEGGLGNLPPLSDFESSDSGLPPMDEDESGGEEEFGSGLPPLSDLSVETPMPTGGNIKPPPPGFEDTDAFDTPMSDSELETPEPADRTGFQDIGADSDFSPETPEIGPGPDSDIDTPMFDSAFGGVGEDQGEGTAAPTQAMETPMFGGEEGEGEEGLGFDDGAFGETPDIGPAEPGTPVPDFSPDTGVPPAGATPPEGKAKKRKKPKTAKAARGGGIGVVVGIILLIVGLVVGVVAGPYIAAQLPFLPNPLSAELDQAQRQIDTLNRQLQNYRQLDTAGGSEVSPERRDQLLQEIAELQAQKTELESAVGAISNEMAEKETQLAMVEEELSLKNDEYVLAVEALEEAENERRLVEARTEGLQAEVNRLTSEVGQLEDANARRLATKEALLHDIERLAITIEEGMPLTPARYDRQERIAAVEALKEKARNAKWATPELIDEYTSLYKQELEIARSREYFFAKIPVTDRFDSTYMKWAECLMNGNWSVYYRTIDGKHVGIFTNTGETNMPKWEFKEQLPETSQKEIAEQIAAFRIDDYQEKMELLAQKQEITEPEQGMQRVFDSL